jgi:hypothetical protein
MHCVESQKKKRHWGPVAVFFMQWDERTTSRVTTDYRGGTANAYKTWLQSIDPQTGGKPAYASYIGAKVAQHFDNTDWGVGVVCCITADPQVGDQNASTGRHLPHKESAFLHHLRGQH